MWDDEQIDAAIDETARQMTAGEPGADFRARVMARIDAGSRVSVAGFAIRSWRPVRGRAALAGLAVAALIVTAVLIRPGPGTTSGSRQDAPPMVRLPPSPLSGFDGPREPDPTYRFDPSTAEREVRRPPSPLRGFGEPRPTLPLGGFGGPGRADATYDLEPLTTAPLELESIAVAAMPPDDSIHPEPLPLASSIAVTPLDVDNQGDRR